MFRATSCLSSGESFVSIQHLVNVTPCLWPFRVQVGKEISDMHTKRSPTQSDIYQMYWHNLFSWWCERGCSKHVQNWNKHIENNCASSWSLTKNHSKLNGQQNKKKVSSSPKLFPPTYWYRLGFVRNVLPNICGPGWLVFNQ
jgi:hypothetical protein